MSSTAQPSDMTRTKIREADKYAASLDRSMDKIFFVTGSHSSKEVFMGRALEESPEGYLLLEGKCLTMSERGRMTVRPFSTRLKLPTEGAGVRMHLLADPEAQREALDLLGQADTRVTRAAAPAIFAWVASALGTQAASERAHISEFQEVSGKSVPSPLEPCRAFYEGFVHTCEVFRRVLFQNPAIQSVRELDQVTELEGNLLIEMGKIANQAAIKLNGIIRRHPELVERADIPVNDVGRSGNRGGYVGASLSGWSGLFVRLNATKSWARANGMVDLVRELNGVIKYGVFGLNELVLDHVNSLDTLITEAFAQYDIRRDIELELTPMPAPGAV